MRIFLIFFAMQVVQYALITMNYRAVAKGKYLATAVTDLIHATIAFTLIKRIATSDSMVAQFGYVVGGVAGAMLGLYLTRKWKDG